MAEKIQPVKRSVTPDWLVQGVLTKVGDFFDRLVGRGWKPSSSLATSELIERLKSILDAEAQSDNNGRKYVPHNIKLKMQWDKFSTDSDDALRKLETELLTAMVDHINDRRYYTYTPISLQVRPDYFTSGVKLYVSFDTDKSERVAQIDSPAPGTEVAEPGIPTDANKAMVIARWQSQGRSSERKLELAEGSRLSVGRTRENDVAIDDISVSKFHASLGLSKEGKLLVADTGSTNGTFINGERIPYGKARELSGNESLKFGSVDVTLEFLPKPVVEITAREADPKTETYSIGEFEFTKRIDLENDHRNNATVERQAANSSEKTEALRRSDTEAS
jgi:pSer/pThr/pTyr-binding forkhead associated (FHA) protein